MSQLRQNLGLRVLTKHMPGTNSATLMIAVATGSRHEADSERGLSHFLEHMMFKGTMKRPTALHIAEALDAVGGEFNAFTDKEMTAYYTKVASQHFDLALDVLSDMLLNSKFDAKEVEREKGVILEEMNMYQDTPMRYVNDLLEGLLYGDTPEGRQIIGTKDSVTAFKREDFVNYWQRQYTAPNMVVAVAGAIEPDLVTKKIERVFGNLASQNAKARGEAMFQQAEPKVHYFQKTTDQTHFRLGVRAFALSDPRRPILQVLSAILGGGMSSRLFTNIRERQGLCYYINSENELYTDHGHLAIQAGVTTIKLNDALSSVGQELNKLSTVEVSEAELRKVKEYIKGKMLLNFEASDAVAGFMARQQALLGKVETLDERLAKIEKVSKSDITKVAREIFLPKHLNLAVIGPKSDPGVLANTLAQYF